MATMTNITVNLNGSVSYTWNASTPGGANEPARWRGESLAPLGIPSRLAQSNLSFYYKRNQANTADRFIVSGYVPIVCDGNSNNCLVTEKGRVPFNFTMVLPDILTDEQRANITNAILNTLASGSVKDAIITGEGYY